MAPVGFGKRRQAAPVEIDPVVMGEVRVFARIHTARLEPDLAFLFINLVHRAYYQGAFGNLILHLAGRAVIQVKMSPAVSLRHPDDLPAVIYIITILAAGLSLVALKG